MTRRVLIGAFPEGGNKYGLRISKAGVDVMNPNQSGYNEKLVFNSDWPAMLPIWAQGVVDVSAGGTITAYYTSIGYNPFCAAFIDIGPGRGWQVYQTAQDYLSKVKAVTLVTNVDMSPVYEFAWEGNTYDNIRINAYTDKITIYSSVALKAYWMVYRTRTF